MHRFASFVIALLAAGAVGAQPRDTFNIYLVDVEGGNATLFVAPSRESLLIDTGNGGPAAMRDADRIMAAVKDAGLTPSVEKNAAADAFLQNVYPPLFANSRHTVVQPGHRFSLGDVEVRIVEAAGKPTTGP